ncbi:MAG: LLM class flavin-dependent oxidoreductase [Geminicoccaceae bacterium]|nr:LLM class flavin-dependent oxidoreductase [Geminicoccaceae bacterium]
MERYSLLDLAPVSEGATPGEALGNTLDLAVRAEALGYHRYWLAEHHNMPGIASAATAVVIGQVAARTRSMRVGAGGIMLPNHAPLVVAEQFGTLEALFPGRIDLGLGRAPGTDQTTARALRRYFDSADKFPEDVVEILSYLEDQPEEAAVRAVPGAGSHVPVWILGSSLFGAQLAAYLGLPYAFASHFAPKMLEQAFSTYRREFRVSKWLDRPHAMMAAGMFVADSDEEAQWLRTSQLLAFARLRTGRPGRLPAPVEDIESLLPGEILSQARNALSCSATGSPTTVRHQMQGLVEHYRPDEVIVTAMIHDHAARCRSFELGAAVLADLVVKRSTNR